MESAHISRLLLSKAQSATLALGPGLIGTLGLSANKDTVGSRMASGSLEFSLHVAGMLICVSQLCCLVFWSTWQRLELWGRGNRS